MHCWLARLSHASQQCSACMAKACSTQGNFCNAAVSLMNSKPLDRAAEEAAARAAAAEHALAAVEQAACGAAQSVAAAEGVMAGRLAQLGAQAQRCTGYTFRAS